MIVYAALFAAFLAWSTHAAEYYCAFHVIVEDTEGRSSGVSVPVVVRDATGSVVASTKTRDGEADICDLGFGRFDIEIGSDKSCGQTVIRNVPTRVGKDVTLRAVWNDCLDPSWLASGCMVLLRARDAEGAPLVGARIETERGVTKLKTGPFGRVLFAMDYGETSTYTLVSDTGRSASATLSCTKKNPKIERTLVLR